MKVLDSYALIEILNGNANFQNIQNEDFKILNLTMSEFWGVVSRRYNETIADHWLNKFKEHCIGAELNILIKARRFKLVNINKNYSFIDCVGYLYAKENNYMFVTGDKEFEGMVCVEYIR